MNQTITNGKLTVTISITGGEILSVVAADGTEFMWQGDETYWAGTAPFMFPFVGRLTGGKYTYEGKTYESEIHGFFRKQTMKLVESTADSITLRLESTKTLQKQYPFKWTVDLTYRLKGNTLFIGFKVTNTDDKTMYFDFGAHPGFNIPLKEGVSFEDYFLEFGATCEPIAIGMSDTCYVLGDETPFKMEKGAKLTLSHQLFDHDAIVLKNTGRSVTLRSKKDKHHIAFQFHQMPYLMMWHKPETTAPYICIEPITGLPSRQDVVEELTRKPDMIRLQAEQVYENNMRVTFL